MIIVAIIQKGSDLLLMEFRNSEVKRNEILDLLIFYFEEKVEPMKDHAILYKENYFDNPFMDGEEVDWKVIDYFIK